MFVAALFTMFQIVQPLKAVADQSVITQNKPQIMGTPEEEIVIAPSEGKKSNALVWIGAIVGVVAVAALVGAGGGSGGDDPQPAAATSGDVAVKW